jgi:hypothetical protein
MDDSSTRHAKGYVQDCVAGMPAGAVERVTRHVAVAMQKALSEAIDWEIVLEDQDEAVGATAAGPAVVQGDAH